MFHPLSLGRPSGVDISVRQTDGRSESERETVGGRRGCLLFPDCATTRLVFTHSSPFHGHCCLMGRNATEDCRLSAQRQNGCVCSQCFCVCVCVCVCAFVCVYVSVSEIGCV